MQYEIEVREALSKTILVESEDRETAIARAMEQYYRCEIFLGKDDLTSVTFHITKEN